MDPKNTLDNLIPDECYTEETKNDGSKNFTCKQCNRSFKKEVSVKQHIESYHKKQSKKRTLSKKDVEIGRTKKKPNLLDEFDFDEPSQHSTQIDIEDDLETTKDIDQFCAFNLTTKPTDDTEVFFELNASVEKILAGDDETLHESIIPDQDHNSERDILEVHEDISEDVNFLKAKVLSLELDVESKDAQLTEKENGIINVKLENSELSKEIENLKQETKIKDEANDIMTAKVNTLEETKSLYEGKLKTYGQMIKKLNNELKDFKANKPVDTNEEVKKLKVQLKQKDGKIVENQRDLKNFVDKLATLESQVKGNSTNITSKYKNLSAELNEKKKEIKQAKDDIDSAKKRTDEFQDLINKKNSKICELEATNTRLQLMYDHSKELNRKGTENVEVKVVEDKPKEEGVKINASPKKCSFENSGNCRKPNCPFLHPKKTCQAHSKYGSCPSESICEHRHPSNICYHLQNVGYCYDGDKCRMRHPIELGAHFLGQNLPSPSRGFHAGFSGGMRGRHQALQEDDIPHLPRGGDSWENQMYRGRARGRAANRGLGNQF